MSPISTNLLPVRTYLRWSLVVVVGVALVWYISFQARFMLEGPVVELSDEPAFTQSDRLVTLSGQARNIVELTLNGREIYTDTDGYFAEALVLENGYTIATITARDRYGREQSYEQTFVYTGTQPNHSNNYGKQENDQENS